MQPWWWRGWAHPRGVVAHDDVDALPRLQAAVVDADRLDVGQVDADPHARGRHVHHVWASDLSWMAHGREKQLAIVGRVPLAAGKLELAVRGVLRRCRQKRLVHHHLLLSSVRFLLPEGDVVHVPGHAGAQQTELREVGLELHDGAEAADVRPTGNESRRRWLRWGRRWGRRWLMDERLQMWRLRHRHRSLRRSLRRSRRRSRRRVERLQRLMRHGLRVLRRR